MAEPVVVDSVFADLDVALEIAAKAQRVPLTPAATGLQVCYYLGDEPPPADAPTNFVHVPIDRFASFLATSRLRPPRSVVGSRRAHSAGDRQAFGTAVNHQMTRGMQDRLRRAMATIQRYKTRVPRPAEGGRLRVFAAASRITTVMQFASAGLVRAFERLGHEVKFEIEQNEMETSDLYTLVVALEAFDPHLVININHQNNAMLPGDVVNAIWWQDLMPALSAGKPLEWRERDLCYAAAWNVLGLPIVATGLAPERVRVQPFCIDDTVFHDGPSDSVREDKVVFVGSAASVRLTGDAAEQRLVNELTRRLEEGQFLTEAEVTALSSAHGVDPRHGFHNVFYAVMRDVPVRWLCRSGARVEVYGRYWDKDPEVAPFFKGELAHGEAVAKVYRSARCALVVHPIEVNTQRLAEAAACGCLPIVYDCRSVAAPPYWEEQVLYFRTAAELATQTRAAASPEAGVFGHHFSYQRFAQRILDDARPFLPAGAA